MAREAAMRAVIVRTSDHASGKQQSRRCGRMATARARDQPGTVFAMTIVAFTAKLRVTCLQTTEPGECTCRHCKVTPASLITTADKKTATDKMMEIGIRQHTVAHDCRRDCWQTGCNGSDGRTGSYPEQLLVSSVTSRYTCSSLENNLEKPRENPLRPLYQIL